MNRLNERAAMMTVDACVSSPDQLRAGHTFKPIAEGNNASLRSGSRQPRRSFDGHQK
jgi:hypothetical protein